MKKLLTVAALLLPLAAAAQYEPVSPAPEYPPSYSSRRSPWYIGFGFGGGGGNVSTPSGDFSLKAYNQAGWSPVPSTSEVSYNFKVGMTMSEKLLLGFDMTGVMSVVTESGVSGSVDIVNYDAVATWFPQGEGLFLRGGAGLSKLTVSWDDGYTSGSDSVSGFNVLAGVGYALWVGQTFNLTLNLDYSLQSYGSAGATNKPESSNFVAAWVGFDWY